MLQKSTFIFWLYILFPFSSFLRSLDVRPSFSLAATIGADGDGRVKAAPSSAGIPASIMRTRGADSFDPNWAVLVCAEHFADIKCFVGNFILLLQVASSRYWFNYRHLANVLVMYQLLKRMGFSDDRIILMNGFDDVCGLRNPVPGRMFWEPNIDVDLCSGVEVDYSGNEVSAESLLRLLTGRLPQGEMLPSRVLSSTNQSNVLLFLSGHGGDGFFKFRDYEEMSADELRAAVEEMSSLGRFRRLLIVADTCQASSMTQTITTENVISIASSRINENSYSYISNKKLGVSTIDRFSMALGSYFDRYVRSRADLSKRTIKDLVASLDRRFLQSTPYVGYSSIELDLEQGASSSADDIINRLSLNEFFGPSVTPWNRARVVHSSEDDEMKDFIGTTVPSVAEETESTHSEHCWFTDCY
jgi:glycosylphosphatidylinositol transamidase (GPIT) subunit GPI8